MQGFQQPDRPSQQRAPDMTVPLELELEELYTGVSVPVCYALYRCAVYLVLVFTTLVFP